MSKPTDFPAFPTNDSDYYGMSLRDYFAAHAPTEPKWWFEPLGYETEKRPIPDYNGVSPYDKDPVNHKEVSQFDRERKVAVAKQWPYVWADAMLSEREKNKE